MNVSSILTLSFLLIVFLACEKQVSVDETQCNSSLSSSVTLDFELLTGTCLENYLGSDDQFRIQNESEYESIMSQFECEEFPRINFGEKELLGSVFSFTGTNETKEEFSLYRDGELVEFLHCITVIPSDHEYVSDVETYLSKWILIDNLNSDDSVIFSVNLD